MKRYLGISLFAIITFFNVSAQQTDSSAQINASAQTVEVEKKQPRYKIKAGIDIPLTVAVDAWSLYGMSVIYGRDQIPEAEILALNRNNVNKFDRPIIDKYSESAKKNSDYLFYGSMPLPLFLLLDKEIRKDGLRVGLLFLQAMGTTGTIYTASAMIADRFRPYAYNPKVPMETRRRGGARNSFLAGHPAVVGTSTFFMAKVYSDYHPNMKHKWILYTVAGGVTAACALFRMQAGQHFKTDVITGIIVGPLVGVLVPHIHKNKKFNSSKLSLFPNLQNGGGGFTAYYKLGK